MSTILYEAMTCNMFPVPRPHACYLGYCIQTYEVKQAVFKVAERYIVYTAELILMSLFLHMIDDHLEGSMLYIYIYDDRGYICLKLNPGMFLSCSSPATCLSQKSTYYGNGFHWRITL